MGRNVNESRFKYLLYTPNLAIFQHHFDAARVIGAGRENSGDDAFGKRAAALVVFFDDLHTGAGFDVASFGDTHMRIHCGRVRASTRRRPYESNLIATI